MDTKIAIMLAEDARRRHKISKVFDWEKAARLIKYHGIKNASAGLEEDWIWTGGTILKDGVPFYSDYTYLSSIWATPVLYDEDEDKVYRCFIPINETRWSHDTLWPQIALDILGVQDEEAN